MDDAEILEDNYKHMIIDTADPDEKNELFKYLESMNYKLFSDFGICMGRRGF